MSGPMFTPTPPGYRQMQGGYQPNPPGQPGQAPAPMPQQMQPQGQPQQPIWQQPNPAGPPIEGAPPPQFQQPQPQQGQSQPQQQGQPQFQQPQQSQQPQQQPQQQGLDLTTRLNGANIPTELQGKTVAEALGLYGNMRSMILQYAQQQPQQRPQQPAPQQGQQPQQPGQQPQQPEWDWRNPTAGIGRVVQEQLAPIQQALQPLLQRTQQDSIMQARNQAAQAFGPDFAAIEPQVLQRLQGADPQALMNPQMWQIAADAVYGQMARSGQLPQRGAQPQQQQYNQWLQPAQHVQQGQQPLPSLNGFFTEAPSQGAPSAGPISLTPTQQWAAQAMGMSMADYAAWSAGMPAGAPGGPR